MLAGTLRLLATPWKLALQRKIRKTIADCEASARPGDMPKMKVVGDPPVRLTEEPTPAQVADFVRWRSPTYVAPMSDQLADAAAMMLLGTDRPEPFDARAMNEMMMRTPSAYLAERDGDWWRFDFTRRRLHPLRRITIHGYAFHAETGEAEIVDYQGRVWRESDPMFETALTHTMCWWCHLIHSGLHNWVHFHLPDCMMEAYTALSDKDSVVARLIGPHVRFTARINMAGLWVNQSTDNGPEWHKRLKPWGASRSDAAGFQRGIIENTGAAYADLEAHFRRPRELDARVPYHAHLSGWYAPIERFVAAVEPHLEDDAWEELIAVLERGLPEIRRIPRADLLAEFIWQVGVVHVTDHATFSPYQRRHGFHVVPEDLERPFTTRDVGRYDRFRTRCFDQTFVSYNGNPELRNGLLDVEAYRFEEDALAAAATAFREDLLATDARLEAEGVRLLRADQLLHSVCF